MIPDLVKTGFKNAHAAGGGGITSIPQSLTVVDATYGTSGGARNDLTKPFQTVAQAIAACSPGDAIMVYPGTYTDKNLTANNLTIIWSAGTSLISTASAGTDACFKFDATHVFSVAGNGHFRIVNPSASNGDIASPSIFNLAGGVTVNVECGLLEGYQTDASKVGQNFIASFDHTTANDLTVLCSGVGGNITIGSPDGLVTILGCFGLAHNLSATSAQGQNFKLTCTGNIAALYDANGNSANQQQFYTFKIKSLGDIYFKQRVATCGDALSFYQCINFVASTITGSFKASTTNTDNLNISADNLTGFIGVACTFALDNGFAAAGGACRTVIKANKAGSPGSTTIGNLNIDTSNDSGETSFTTIDIPYIVSDATVKLYGGTVIRCAIWFTNGHGFDGGSATKNVEMGYMVADAGFSQGSSPIAAGILEINAGIF